MADRETLVVWVSDALLQLGGKARVIDVAKMIWDRHNPELKASGDLFYTWQYDMRWAALKLRKNKVLKAADETPRGVCAISR